MGRADPWISGGLRAILALSDTGLDREKIVGRKFAEIAL